jgi:Bacterial PH domain
MMWRRNDPDRKAARLAATVDRSLRAQLFDGEKVLLVARPGRFATLPKFVLSLGLYAFWRRRDSSVLTDERVLLGKGLWRRNERSILLSRIEDVGYARSGLNSYASVTVHGPRSTDVERIGPMSPTMAHRFARETLRRI